MSTGRIDGRLVVHMFDAAHLLGLGAPDTLFDPAVTGASRARLIALLASRLTLSLAALNLVSAPDRMIEPAIALSIVYVGADTTHRR